jgi:hypothetical protein
LAFPSRENGPDPGGHRSGTGGRACSRSGSGIPWTIAAGFCVRRWPFWIFWLDWILLSWKRLKITKKRLKFHIWFLDAKICNEKNSYLIFGCKNLQWKILIQSTLEIAALDLTVSIFGPKELEILIFTLDLAV